MRVLLTGATGLIGKEIGKKLVAAGHQLHVVSRSKERAQFELPFPAKVFSWAGGDCEFPLEALEGVQAVINLAGESVAESRWTKEKKRAIRESRILGTRRIVDAVKKARVRLNTFVQGSAIGFYGDRGDEVLTEESPMGEGFLSGLVRDWEAEVAPIFESGVRVVIVRTALVFSRRAGAMGKLIPIFSKGVGGKLASGNQWMSWVHIEDIVRAFVFCLENEMVSGIVNASAPEPVRNDRFTVAFARALGRPVFLPMPEAALRAVLGEAASAVLASERVRPQRLQEFGFRFHHPEIVPALEELCAPIRNGQHELVVEQWVPKRPEEMFPFLSCETNLECLTPPAMKFKVIGKSAGAIGAGTRLDYRLSVHGIPMRWRSLIEDWDAGKSFVDVQERGPYRKWHHKHEFIPLAGGTLIRDRILYRLPLGAIGDVLAGWRVKRDMKEIFEFRRKMINDRFGHQA